MENARSSDGVEKLPSHLIDEKLNDPVGAVEEKIVIPDECGDTLWDEILENPAKILPGKDSAENKGLTISTSDPKE